ncbi:hypothetical protein BKG83_22610 [Mycobacteroides chelonae]|uniref:HTH deoR-type domain-containing protein n=1 Tax=Mycobacteroides chelonae TaxID=1774 RepID=A0A1S1LYT7_MYCCH|nr:WYL domain-containing protein [Mycobacteroides chelonae]PKQ57439.1 hypothetical protein B5566_13905 [Mycobacterium sp. MHSD3]SKL74220.1 helix-turn-helix, type 11 domain-containing protein [Mycobacteroides abscessus subsp. bolletii]MBF9521618.1 WYL domain-containing protein [Mycobacteroides chelonae]OHU50069.1 hypothetical protein BKG83_22610 [Mycobacteroides chelonae]OHU75808.1 hypothetical protein BKG84_26575 [Mycobacteroides chelonae]
MLETSARLLRMLSMLQARPMWSGTELAERLNVSTRTVRADIERLRTLGYRIESAPGTAGGYRFESGGALPLLLDDEEATAVALSLRTAANGAVTGIEETALRALAKLLQAMPTRLRHRADALLEVTATPPLPGVGTTVAASVLVELARAIRARERLRFDYTDQVGWHSQRIVEPERLVHRWGRWYLLAFDMDRDERRTFRADRIVPRPPTGPQFNHRPGAAQYLQHALSRGTWDYEAQILVHCPATVAHQRLPSETAITAAGDSSCMVVIGASSAAATVAYLCSLDAEFEIIEAEGLADQLRLTAQRFSHAAELDRPDTRVDGAN